MAYSLRWFCLESFWHILLRRSRTRAITGKVCLRKNFLRLLMKHLQQSFDANKFSASCFSLSWIHGTSQFFFYWHKCKEKHTIVEGNQDDATSSRRTWLKSLLEQKEKLQHRWGFWPPILHPKLSRKYVIFFQKITPIAIIMLMQTHFSCCRGVHMVKVQENSIQDASHNHLSNNSPLIIVHVN